VQTPLPQYTQTNRTIFAPAPTPSSPSDHHIVFISTGSGIVKVAAYPTNPSSSTTAATLTPLHTINSHTSSCSCLELSPNGRYLATGGSDALISLWDTQDWVCRRTLARMVGGVKSLSFSWDGNYIVGGSDEGTGLEIAHVESGEYVHTVPTSVPACCVAWHPSRYWLAYSGDTGGLKIVGAAGGQL
jgi:THO complex subunit 3